MDALQVMLGMTILRILLPVSILLGIGEWANRHGRPRYGRR